jgi:membrane protein CcdC involved in cytochrome C biogenesis
MSCCFGIIEEEVGSTVHIGFGTSAIGAVIGLLGVLAWRIREGRTAVTIKKIIMPPLGMATGFSMFLLPAFRVPWTWALGAFLIGMLALAYPLLITSRLVRAGDTIMMQRSNAFFLVVIALAAIRYFARGYFDHIMSIDQTAGLFFVLAFGMILRWRAQMLLEYRKLT